MTAVITISSGSPQSGKSLISANLAHYLTSKGHRTALLSAGSRQPLWEVPPIATWPNVIAGRLPLDRIIHRDIYTVDMIVAHGHGHALGQFADLHEESLAAEIEAQDNYTYLIVDLAGGVSSAAMACCLASAENILVPAANTTALTAAYEWLAHLSRNGMIRPVNLILNQTRKPAQAQTAYIRFRDLVHNRLELKTNLWGSITYDAAVERWDALRRPLVDTVPHSRIIKDIRTVGDRLLAEQPPENQTGQLITFWREFNQHLQQLPTTPIRPPAKPKADLAPDDNSTPEVIDSPAGSDTQGNHAAAMENINQNLYLIFQELRAIRKLLESRRADPAVQPGHERLD
jgi:MinD-like ATPase involved in chromosome partitioning or flagellar assembly